MDLHSPVKTVSKIFQVMNGIFKSSLVNSKGTNLLDAVRSGQSKLMMSLGSSLCKI